MAEGQPADPQPSIMASQETIHLKIKVPPGHLSSTSTTDSPSSSSFDLGLLDVHTKVGDLRSRIQSNVPTNPAPERQRLLYGGRALIDNEQTLQDALNTKRDPQQREYVLHLLVRGEGMASSIVRPRSANIEHRRTGSAPPPIERQNSARQRVAAAIINQEGQIPVDPMQIHQQMHAQAVQQAMQSPFGQFQQPQMPQMPQGMQIPQFAGQMPGQPAAMAGFQMMPNGMPMPFPIHMGQREVREPMQQQPSGTSATPSQANGRASAPPAQTQEQQQGHLPQDQSQQPQAQQQPPFNAQNPWQGVYRVEARGPNGERIQLQHQTFNLPGQGPNQAFRPPPFGQPSGQMMPQAMPVVPGAPQGFQMPIPPPQQFLPPFLPRGPAPPQQQQAGTTREPSALDRARQNMAEMRRMLDDMRHQTAALSDEERNRRIGEVEYRARQVEGYIDPFNVGAQTNATNTGTGNVAHPAAAPRTQTMPQPPHMPPHRRLYNPFRAHPGMEQNQQPPSDPNAVTAYLLSSPEGPQAMLFSPQFGSYTGAFTTTAQPAPTRTIQPGAMQRYVGQPFPYTQQAPTVTAGAQAAGQQAAQQDPVARAAAAHLANGAMAQQAANARAVAAGQNPGIQDPLAPIQPLLAHFWLLIRILIFAYFLLGSNLGLTRPLILVGIGMVFWAVRMGALGEQGAAVRRWWDGIVGVPERRPEGGQQGQGHANPAQAPGQQQQNAAAGGQAPQPDQQNAAPAQGGRQQQRMPTPEQVAQRLLNEDAARRNERRNWFLRQIRPVERAAALFVASLWPGVGEAHARAREQEQRRLQEEEVAARRRAEEESANANANVADKDQSKVAEKKEGKAGEAGASTNEKVEGAEAQAESAKSSEKTATET